MGTITTTLDTKVYDLLKKLAGESEKTEQKLVEELIKKEDEKRHVKNVPYLGEKRFKCTRKECFETQIEVMDVVEIGN